MSVALVASSCYVGVLEGSLLDHTSLGNNVGSTDLKSLMKDGRRLRIGEMTSWRWQMDVSGLGIADEVGYVAWTDDPSTNNLFSIANIQCSQL